MLWLFLSFYVACTLGHEGGGPRSRKPDTPAVGKPLPATSTTSPTKLNASILVGSAHSAVSQIFPQGPTLHPDTSRARGLRIRPIRFADNSGNGRDLTASSQPTSAVGVEADVFSVGMNAATMNATMASQDCYGADAGSAQVFGQGSHSLDLFGQFGRSFSIGAVFNGGVFQSASGAGGDVSNEFPQDFGHPSSPDFFADFDSSTLASRPSFFGALDGIDFEDSALLARWLQSDPGGDSSDPLASEESIAALPSDDLPSAVHLHRDVSDLSPQRTVGGGSHAVPHTAPEERNAASLGGSFPDGLDSHRDAAARSPQREKSPSPPHRGGTD